MKRIEHAVKRVGACLLAAALEDLRAVSVFFSEACVPFFFFVPAANALKSHSVLSA